MLDELKKKQFHIDQFKENEKQLREQKEDLEGDVKFYEMALKKIQASNELGIKRVSYLEKKYTTLRKKSVNLCK